MQLAELSRNNNLKLPEEIGGRFKVSDRFVIIADKETIFLKKIRTGKVTDIAKRVNDLMGEMSMEDIVKAVHQCRRERKKSND